jgi:hypothetical protein
MAKEKFTQEWLDNLRTKGFSYQDKFSNKVDVQIKDSKPAKRNGKYNAIKVEDPETGTMIDSKIEAAHVAVFRKELKEGIIQTYSRQVEFYILSIGCKYIADHGWFDSDWVYHVADSKGMQTPEFKLKWKAVQLQYPNIKFHLITDKKFKGTATL